ncbi:MAG TPA: hypothetical protein VH475_14755, partial [Tepidisphaeraceae bacterium]
SLRNTLQIQPDVKLNSAHLFAQVDGWLYPDRVVNKTQFNLGDVAATNKSGKITLEPITSTIDVTYAPPGAAGEPFKITALRDVGLALESGFAKLSGETGKGGTLAQFNLRGDGDLGKLQQQLAQFHDFGKMQVQGAWKLAATTNGDPTKENAAIKTNVKFTATNLVVNGLAGVAPIREPWLDVTADGNVHLEKNKPQSLTEGVVVLKSNSAENPTVDVRLAGDVDLSTFASKRFDLTAKAMLAKARDEFAAVAPSLGYVESGQLTATAGGSYDGKRLKLDPTTAVKVADLSVRQSTAAGAPVVLRNQAVDVALAGAISTSVEELGADLSALAVSAPKLLEIKKADGPLKVILARGGAKKRITGSGGIAIAYADLKRIGDLRKSFTPTTQPAATEGAGQLTRAMLSGALNFNRADQPVTTIAGNFSADVGVATAKEPINEKIAITLDGAQPDDFAQPLKANLNVKSNTLNAAVTDAVLVLAADSPIDLVRQAKVSVTADRLEMVQAMMDSFIPPSQPNAGGAPAPQQPRVTGEERISGNERISRAPEPDLEPASPQSVRGPDRPLPSLKVLSGRLALVANVSRENQTTLVKDTSLTINNLSFRRGDGFYESKDGKIDLKLSAAIDTDANPAAASAIRKLQIQELSGDLDAGQLKLTQPIVVTNLAAPLPSISGGVQMTGALAVGLRMLEALQGAKPASKYPYTGNYDLTEAISTQGNTIRLVGGLKASKFRAYDPTDLKTVTFAEDLLTIANDVAADSTTDTATLNNLALNMQSTGALALAITNGQLIDWSDQRKIAKELDAKLRIDWPRLWPIVKPMLDPDTQKSLEDLQLAGVMERTFKVNGSFPATGTDKQGRRIELDTAQALRFINAYGGLHFDRVAVSGLDVRNLDLPVSLERGICYIQDATKPKGQRYPQPFACNDGTIDIGGLQIDLRHVAANGSILPWFTIPDANKVIFKNVALNPLFADSTIGNYVNPGFAGATDARGRVTLTSVECRDVPLDWFTASKKPGQAPPQQPQQPAHRQRTTQSDGRAEFLLAISEMQLKAPLLPFLLNTDTLSGQVTKGRITVENGIVRSDIPMELENGRMTLAWTGAVNLQDRQILNFNTAIPKQLIAELPILRNNAKFIPNVINVPIAGAFDKPHIDLAGAVTKSFLPGIGSGKPEDIINQLPGLLGGGGKKDKDKDNPSAQDKNMRSGNSDDPLAGLRDLAGGLLNQKGSGGGTNPADRAAPAPANDRVTGNERISGEPRTASERRPAAPVTGDERISSTPRPTTTTAPTTTAPAERNVSGRTRAARQRANEDK